MKKKRMPTVVKGSQIKFKRGDKLLFGTIRSVHATGSKRWMKVEVEVKGKPVEYSPVWERELISDEIEVQDKSSVKTQESIQESSLHNVTVIKGAYAAPEPQKKVDKSSRYVRSAVQKALQLVEDGFDRADKSSRDVTETFKMILKDHPSFISANVKTVNEVDIKMQNNNDASECIRRIASALALTVSKLNIEPGIKVHAVIEIDDDYKKENRRKAKIIRREFEHASGHRDIEQTVGYAVYNEKDNTWTLRMHEAVLIRSTLDELIELMPGGRTMFRYETIEDIRETVSRADVLRRSAGISKDTAMVKAPFGWLETAVDVQLKRNGGVQLVQSGTQIYVHKNRNASGTLRVVYGGLVYELENLTHEQVKQVSRITFNENVEKINECVDQEICETITSVRFTGAPTKITSVVNKLNDMSNGAVSAEAVGRYRITVKGLAPAVREALQSIRDQIHMPKIVHDVKPHDKLVSTGAIDQLAELFSSFMGVNARDAAERLLTRWIESGGVGSMRHAMRSCSIYGLDSDGETVCASILDGVMQ